MEILYLAFHLTFRTYIMKTVTTKQFVFLFILTSFIATIDGNIIVGTNNGTQFELNAVEIIYLKSNNERIVDSLTLQPTINEDDVDGKIFVFESGLTDDIIIRRVQSKGALAVINLSVAYVVGGYMRYRFMDHEAIQAITIPIFEVVTIDKDKIWPLLQQNQVSNITLLPSDETNPWDLVLLSPGYYLYTVVLMVFCATNIALAIWKMKLFIEVYGGIRVSFSLAVLFLEIISNLIRIAGLIDLFGVNSLYDEFTATVFYMMSFPFVLASIMLFSLYWHEIMTSSAIVVHPFIVKMRVPFFVLSGLLLLFQVAAILVRRFLVSNFALVGTLIYLFVSIGLFIFYVITASKLLRRLQASTKKGRKFRNLKQTTVKILISVCFLFGMIIVGAQFAVDTAYTPIGYFMCWYSLYLTINCSSMLNILAFGIPKQAMSTSQHSDKKPSTSNKQSSGSASTNTVDMKETTVTV